MGADLSQLFDWSFPTTYDDAVFYFNNLDQHSLTLSDQQLFDREMLSQRVRFLITLGSLRKSLTCEHDTQLQRMEFLFTLQCLHEMLRIQRMEDLRIVPPNTFRLALTKILTQFRIHIYLDDGISSKWCCVPVFVQCQLLCVKFADLDKSFPGLEPWKPNRGSTVVFDLNFSLDNLKLEGQSTCIFIRNGKVVRCKVNVLTDFSVFQVHTRVEESLVKVLHFRLVEIVKDFIGVRSADESW